MRYKRKLIAVMIVVAVLTVIQFLLPDNSRVVAFYDEWIFRPFQSARNVVFSVVPVSVGDILYIVGGIVLLVTIARWIYFITRFRTHKHYLAHSLLHSVITLGVIYIVFILGWGGNYYKTSLSDYWGITHTRPSGDSSMVQFDRFLVHRLNEYAPGYQEAKFGEIDRRAQDYYRDYTDSRTRAHGIKAKASIFGFWMQHLAIQGYYNPFTGEAQVNRFLPPFMLPFVICHEMAHQAGIAAEDDANLLAYAVGSAPQDSLFRYSSYLNLWLYTHARLRMTDSSLAKSLRAELNPLTLSHLDTLKAIRRRYASDVSDYSGALYDGYLRLHHQKDGIESYNKVAVSAWEWEQRRAKEGVIRIP